MSLPYPEQNVEFKDKKAYCKPCNVEMKQFIEEHWKKCDCKYCKDLTSGKEKAYRCPKCKMTAYAWFIEVI